MSEHPRSRERGRPELCAKPPRQPRPTLRASAVALPRNRWTSRAWDASRSRLGLAVLAGCGGLLAAAVLRCSSSRPPGQTRRSDLCSRHQHGSSGHSACFVLPVLQPCQMNQVCRDLARHAELVALAATHAPSDLPLMAIAPIQRVLGHAACARLYRRRATIHSMALMRFVCLSPTCPGLVRKVSDLRIRSMLARYLHCTTHTECRSALEPQWSTQTSLDGPYTRF